MDSLLVYTLVISIFYGQACKPVLRPITESKEGRDSRLECNINGILECTNIIKSMIWERYSAADDEWDKAFQMSKSGSFQSFTTRYEYALGGRAAGVKNGDLYELRISGTILEDSGDWRCVVEDDPNQYAGDPKLFQVTRDSLPEEEIVVSSKSEYLVPTVPSEYTCVVDRCFPKVAPQWEVGGQLYNGTSRFPYNGYIYQIESTLTVSIDNILQPTVTCILDKSEGETWEQRRSLTFEPNDIKAPPVVESAGPTSVEITLDSVLTLECIVSGADIEILWSFNDKSLSASLFDEVTDTQYQGNFSFGASSATKSTLTWKRPSGSLCSEKLKHVGVYRCTGQGVDDISVLGHPVTVQFTETPSCISSGGLAGIIVGVVASIAAIIAVIGILYKTKCSANTTH